MNAYVLVGGRSRRMGSSKVELFLERIVAAARPVFDEVIAVDRYGVRQRQLPLSNAAAELRRAAASLPHLKAAAGAAALHTIFEEPHDDEAAIFGVARALRDANGKAFLLAVDYPLITSEVLRYLVEREAMPVWNGEPQLLCAVWDAALLPRVEERIAARRYDLRTLGGQEMIPESELRARFRGEPLMNVNTPEEWERAQRFLASR